jgi:NAD-dependent dihydropyrimidine dehydrogenase PreA subunit/flavodoxin
MEIKRVWALYWSATGNTRKVVSAVAEAAAAALNCPCETVDFTLPAVCERDFSFTATDLAVVGLPTYAGRLPNKIAPFVREHLHGGGAMAVGVVTFGNRSYDNALAELCAALTADGFCPTAAGAFAGRHAFTDDLAWGRPGPEDLRQAKSLGMKAAEKVKSLTGIPAPVTVPGDPEAPYYVPLGTDGQPAKFLKAKPRTDPARCSRCGVCARVCPMGAIDPKNVEEVPGICIKCQACVRRCTKHAKYFDDPAFLSHVAMVAKTFSQPKENEVFL